MLPAQADSAAFKWSARQTGGRNVRPNKLTRKTNWQTRKTQDHGGPAGLVASIDDKYRKSFTNLGFRTLNKASITPVLSGQSPIPARIGDQKEARNC